MVPITNPARLLPEATSGVVTTSHDLMCDFLSYCIENGFQYTFSVKRSNWVDGLFLCTFRASHSVMNSYLLYKQKITQYHA